ncbi:hypothetical protein KAX17_02850 [Candidatus Bipolaricaulota bacterium]|nr:hypothetical protein [Candidatus Bipolaricaulota bacterium]
MRYVNAGFVLTHSRRFEIDPPHGLSVYRVGLSSSGCCARQHGRRPALFFSFNDRGLPALRGTSFDLYEGEILGVAGVSGNVKRSLLKCSPACGGRPEGGGLPWAGKR